MWRKFLSITLIMFAGTVWAADNDTGGVVVKNAWVSASTPGQTTAFIQLDLTSTAKSGKLVGIDSPVSDAAEVQRPWPSGGKIKMVKVPKVRLAHGATTSFGQHAVYYLALLGLKQPLKPGDHIPVNLTVVLSDGNKVVVPVQVEVKTADSNAPQYPQQELPVNPDQAKSGAVKPGAK